MDKERLKGKNVLITGAAQGMGAAIAEHYCAQGAKVCITDVNLDGCKEVEERIRSAGGEAISCKLDVRKREDHVAAVNATVEAFGSLNVSLNNAGVNKPLWFMDVTEENYDFIFDITDDTYYCSEIIYEGLQVADSNQQIMQLNPMTFNEPGTNSPFVHWIEYYEELNHEIPEGELGLNPGGMSRSEGLEIIYMFEKPSGYVN